MLRFTVIIVTRDRAASLAETLVALSGLSYHGSWEALVVDNGSTDHTRAVVHRLAETFPVRLRYLSEPAGGKYSGLNAGIRAADGACIAATDDDAFPVGDWLEHAHTALVADGYDFAGGPVRPIWRGRRPRWVDGEGAIIGKVLGLQDHGARPREYGVDGVSWPLGVNVAYRRDCFDRVGYFDTRLGRVAGTLRNQAQREWHIRARDLGVRGRYLPGMAVRHVVNAQRLNRGYFHRWFFWHGISRALMYENHGLHLFEPEGIATHAEEMHLFGAPLSLYRYGGLAALSAAKRWMTGRQDAALAYELAVSFALGVCWERARYWGRQRRWRRSCGPDEVSPSTRAGSEAPPRPSPARLPSGACIWLTGLSGAGKTTTAKALEDLLRRRCPIRVVDGDTPRPGSPPGTSPFSMTDRHAHAVRVAELARRHADDGILVVCVLISPYSHSRSEARTIIGAHRFVEAFVNTPRDVCMTRDERGRYAKALRGDLSRVTGIDDPYEPPANPDIVLDTLSQTPFANALAIADLLEARGLMPQECAGVQADGRTPDPAGRVPPRDDLNIANLECPPTAGGRASS